ncbi:MAG TPA: YdcF family protein [Gaiellaceae bacterium]
MIRRLLILVGALAAAWLAACLVLFVWPPAETGAPAHADAVVVLSGSTRRLPPALALIRRHVAPVLAISSVSLTPKWKAARRLCRAGTYDGARVVCFLATPYSTRGEARAVARLAKARDWHSVVVVSSTFHLTRTKLLFRRCYHGRLSLVGAPMTWWRLPGEWASETAKLVAQVVFVRGC